MYIRYEDLLYIVSNKFIKKLLGSVSSRDFLLSCSGLGRMVTDSAGNKVVNSPQLMAINNMVPHANES